MANEVDLDTAARDLQKTGDFGMFYTHDETSAEQRERLDTLFGRVFWFIMREEDPANVPETPFGAAEFRAMMTDMPDDASG